MKTPKTRNELVDILGRNAVMDATGWSNGTLRTLLSVGFPAKWFIILKTLCDEKDVELPTEFFPSMKKDQR